MRPVCPPHRLAESARTPQHTRYLFAGAATTNPGGRRQPDPVRVSSTAPSQGLRPRGHVETRRLRMGTQPPNRGPASAGTASGRAPVVGRRAGTIANQGERFSCPDSQLGNALWNLCWRPCQHLGAGADTTAPATFVTQGRPVGVNVVTRTGRILAQEAMCRLGQEQRSKCAEGRTIE